MRHLWSLLAGIVAAPLSWLFLAAGQHRSQLTVQGWFEAGVFDTADLIGPAALLAVAGIVLGLIGTLRWSPAGPLAAGLLLVVPTIVMFVDPFVVRDAVATDEQRRLLGQDLDLLLPVGNGTLLVLGALLLVAVLSAGRRRPSPVAPAAEPAAEPTAAGDEVAETRSAPEILEPVGATESPTDESRPDRE
jgi:hypothetical protein